MKFLHVIRIETAPGGAVHLITEGGERVIVLRNDDEGYSSVRVTGTTEEDPGRHLLSVEGLPRRDAEPALF
jgi:hypothetical protein